MASKHQPPSRTADQFVVRLPSGMRDRIKRLSDELGRSMNAQIVFMLEQYLASLDGQVHELQDALDKRAKAMERLAAYNIGELKLAMLKVLSFEEFMILQDRVADLGGTDRVLETPEAELKRQALDKTIQRSESESQSFYSKIVGNTSLTTLLTTDEIGKIAERIVQLEHAHKAVRAKAAELNERFALTRNIAATPQTQGSQTPEIPGVNAPKKGLGAAPKEPKEPQRRVIIRKRRVVKDDKEKDE